MVQAARDARLSIQLTGIRTESQTAPVSAVGKRNFPGQRQRPRNGPCNSMGRLQRQNACTNRRQFGAIRTGGVNRTDFVPVERAAMPQRHVHLLFGPPEFVPLVAQVCPNSEPRLGAGVRLKMLFATSREISVCARIGGAERTRTSNQTILRL
jgi:hypothetical protein